MANPTLITFDVYMALLDIQGGLSDAFAEAAKLPLAQAHSMVALWRTKQMERAASSNALGLGHTLFQACTEMSLDYVAARHDLNISASARTQLVQSWSSLQPWPEADAALAAVKARGYQIAILSNGDQQMLDSVAAQFSTSFDHVLSAETVAHYKPHPDIYALPATQLGIAGEATVHVAGSANDVLGAVAFGLRCVWSNRNNEPLVDPHFPPTHQIQKLTELAAVL